MSATEVSILFSSSDKLTDSIRQMRKGVRDLSKDITEYRKIQDDAFEKSIKVDFETEEAMKKLKELRTEYKKGGDVSEEALKEQIKKTRLLKIEQQELLKVIKLSRSEEEKLRESQSRNDNRNASRNMMSDLSRAGLGNMIGSAVGEYGGSLATSMYGDTTGNYISSIGGGIATGAAIGSVGGIGIGTAIGGVVGGISGAIDGMSKEMQTRDNYFTTEVYDLVSTIKQERETNIRAGTESFVSREINKKGLENLLGSKEKGDKMFEDIRKYGQDTPYFADSMLNSAKQMLAYGIKSENVMSDIAMLGNVGLGDQNKFNSLSYAYAQTQAAGKLTGQDLLQYTSAGFNPLTILGEEQNKTLQEMRDLMSQGLVSSADVTKAFEIATSEGGKYYRAVETLMDTYAGQSSILADIKQNIQMGYGVGYAEKRKQGIELEVAVLGGAIGERFKKSNAYIGEYEASLENDYQMQLIRAEKFAMDTDEYKKAMAMNDGVTMGGILAEARVDAEILHKNSEKNKDGIKVEMDLIGSIQETLRLNGQYLELSRQMAEQLSKGFTPESKLGIELATTVTEDMKNQHGVGAKSDPLKEAFKYTAEMREKYKSPTQFGGTTENNGTDFAKENFATGIHRVPYNNMPAFLHEGERVLTRVQTDKMDKENPVAPVINITVNNNGRSTYEITQEIVRELQKAAQSFTGAR